MTEEKIIKGYDPVIMRRLLSFLKPYGWAVTVAVVALFISIGAELLLPVLVQRTIDRHIVVNYFRFPAEYENDSRIEKLRLEDSDPVIGAYRYVHSDKLANITAVSKEELTEAGILDSSQWYVFQRDESDIETLPQEAHSSLELGEAAGALPMETMKALSPEQRRGLRKGDIAGVAENSGYYFILLVAVLLFGFVQVYLMAYSGQGVMRDLRKRLLGHAMRQNLGYLGNTPVGSMVSRVTNDVETINELFTSVATSLLKDVALMAGVIVTLYFLNPRLATVTVLTLPPVIIATFFFRRQARNAFRKVRMWVSRVNAFLSEHISGMDIVQIFGREKRSMEEFEDKNKSLLKANLGEMYVFASFRPVVNFLTSLSIGIVIYYGAGMFFNTTVTLGILVAFINLINQFYAPVMDLSEKFNILQSAMAGGERVFNLLDTREEIPDEGKKELPQKTPGKIEFDHVSFSYIEDEPVLRDISFSVEPGETVAIVGYTGAGKTTIANLLTRLWDIQAGSIRLDGIDIREYTLDSLRKAVQPVQQDVFLFSGTVKDNIRMGSDISESDIHRAAETVQADSFISEMPEGYDGMLGERGSNISTGQRQLLAFARAVAHDPSVIILDEATSNIDTETEKLIQHAMDVLLEGRTSLVIAHRLSTIKHADRILVLSQGTLVEEGSHEELLRKEGVYYNLYKLQYAGLEA